MVFAQALRAVPKRVASTEGPHIVRAAARSALEQRSGRRCELHAEGIHFPLSAHAHATEAHNEGAPLGFDRSEADAPVGAQIASACECRLMISAQLTHIALAQPLGACG